MPIAPIRADIIDKPSKADSGLITFSTTSISSLNTSSVEGKMSDSYLSAAAYGDCSFTLVNWQARIKSNFSKFTRIQKMPSINRSLN